MSIHLKCVIFGLIIVRPADNVWAYEVKFDLSHELNTASSDGNRPALNSEQRLSFSIYESTEIAFVNLLFFWRSTGIMRCKHNIFVETTSKRTAQNNDNNE